MADNIVNFPGYTSLDIDPDRVLDGAKGELEQVMVLGYDQSGDLYVSSSTADVGILLRLVETFKFKLLNGDFN